VSEPSVLKKTLAKLIKQVEQQKVNPNGYKEIYNQLPFLRFFVFYAEVEITKKANEAKTRLFKKLGIKINDDEILQFILAIPVLQPYLDKYISITEQSTGGSGGKARWIIANHLRELLSKKNPALLKKLSSDASCVVRDKKCLTHGELCVRLNYGPGDFFGSEFEAVKK